MIGALAFAAEGNPCAARERLEHYASEEAEQLADAGLSLDPSKPLQAELLDFRAEARYRAGVANYLEVLDSQRSLFEAELALSQAQLLQLTAAVQLYKALGGSWSGDGEGAETR